MKKIFFFFIIIIFISCTPDKNQKSLTDINDGHLNYLLQEVKLSGENAALVYIYCEYPKYNLVGDEDEGIACADDAARAAIFYIREFIHNSDSLSLRRAELITNFLLYMQSENGFFYNFVFDDLSINKNHKNSINKANWWTWRALWALTEMYPVAVQTNNKLADEIRKSLDLSFSSIRKFLTSEKNMVSFNGFDLPTWLPYQYAADQAALLLIVLSNYYQISNQKEIIPLVNQLGDGIIQMQIQQQDFEANGVFLSWRTMWHGWGNVQAYALLKASDVFKIEKFKSAALNEIENYYPWLIKNNYFNSFELERQNNKILITDRKKYDQIAYELRPMIFACLEAYRLTNNNKYTDMAAELAMWFFGRNPAKVIMYDSYSGRCYDGINSRNKVNLNSGAESTIEALLALQAIQIVEEAQQILQTLTSSQ